MERYNGWTNYETWKANLEIFDGWEPDGFDDEILECYKKGKWNKDALKDVAYEYGDFLRRMLEDQYEDIGDDLLESIFNAFVAEINFKEIAENIIDDYKETLI